MQVNDLLDQLEAKPGAFRAVMPLEKRLENPLPQLRGDALPFIGNFNPVPSDNHRNGTCAAAMIDGILHEIGHHSFQGNGIARHDRVGGGCFETDFIPSGECQRTHIENDTLRELDEINIDEMARDGIVHNAEEPNSA